MKKVHILSFLVALTILLSSNKEKNNRDKIQEKAQKEQKNIVIYFSGSPPVSPSLHETE